MQKRLGRLQAMASCLDGLIERIGQQPGAFRRFKIGSTVFGNVVDATRDRVEIRLGPGARVRWDWARLSSERLERLLIRAGLTGEAGVEAATVLLDMGDPPRALKVLADRFEREPGLRSRVEELICEARGMKTLPAGGFHLHDGRLMTGAERDEAVLVAKLAKFGKLIIDAEPGQWSQPADSLRALGARGDEQLQAALTARIGAFKEKLDNVRILKRKNLGQLRAEMFAELGERRKVALALIFDKKKYPYPYAPNQKEVQAEVDGFVARCAAIWETPSAWVLEKEPALKILLDDAQSVAEAVAALGGKVDAPAALLKRIDERIDMRHYDGGKSIVSHWKSVIEHNDAMLADGIISQPERDCYSGTNQYRVMMGMKAVMADESLVKCARGHSTEMLVKGYFSHTSPTPGRESPGKRARLAGWGGSVSENIARGRADGFQVVRQWCHSSGHHRNILGRRWTHLGAGKAEAGAFWTQNFGTGRSKPPKRGKEDPKRRRRKGK